MPLRRRWGRAAMGTLALLLAVVGPAKVRAEAADPALRDARIIDALHRGADYLLQHKNGDGWEPTGRCEWMPLQSGAATGAVLYALLSAGESLDEPRLRRNSPELAPVIKWLTAQNPTGNYGLAYQVLALAGSSKQPEIRAAVDRARRTLLAAQLPNGAYDYCPAHNKGNLTPTWWDNSNTQIVQLAMWTAEDEGFEVPATYWTKLDAHWRKQQDVSGGWAYYTGTPGGRPEWMVISPQMTAAGVASLFISGQYTDAAPRLEPRPDKALDHGLAWLASHHAEGAGDLYYLYTCERVGLASGLKELGGVDWFQEGAERLLREQRPDGSWPTRIKWSTDFSNVQVLNTAFAMLFLARGSNPVLLNKLHYPDPKPGTPSRWNARPRDAANLTHWISRQFEAPLNWQAVQLESGVESWLDAPILLLTGSKDPQFSPEHIAKLRAFVQAGGLIFSSSDGASPEFSAEIAKIAQQVGGERANWRPLPKEHAVYSLTRKTAPMLLFGLSNGVRELWIHSPGDFGAVWQRRGTSNNDVWSIPTNVVFYATGKGSLRHRHAHLPVAAAGHAERTLTLARLQYTGNWDPEPAAWPRFAALARRDFRTDLTLTTVPLDALDPAATPLAHLTGTEALILTPAETDKLKAFLNGGGTLLPGKTLRPVAADEPLLAGGAPGTAKLAAVTYRRFNTLTRGASTEPNLFAIPRDPGRPGYCVILAPDDLTSGLLGAETWGIAGYAPDSAAALVRNILLTCAPKP